MKGDKILFFSGPLNFAKKEIYCIWTQLATKSWISAI